MLTARKKAFVDFYKQTRNGAEAARLANYSPKVASNIAYKLLHYDQDVQQIIKQWEQDEQKKVIEEQEKYRPSKEKYINGIFIRELECSHPPTKAKYYELGGKALGYLSDERTESAPVFQIVCNELRLSLNGKRKPPYIRKEGTDQPLSQPISESVTPTPLAESSSPIVESTNNTPTDSTTQPLKTDVDDVTHV